MNFARTQPGAADFGPWATAIAEGTGPQLSSLWRRRMTMLPLVSPKMSGASRRAGWSVALLALVLAALPTLDAAAAADPDDAAVAERRLQRLEKKLQTLRDEIAALRKKREAASDQVARKSLQYLARNDYCTRCHVSPTPTVDFYHGLGDGKFEARKAGVAFVDFDSDGKLDLLLANPHSCPSANSCRMTEKIPALADVSLLGRLFVYKEAASAEENLSRKTYKLPKAKAEALAAFLREHVKAPVMEPRVEGDALIVTTTPEVQQGVGQLVGLIHKEPAEKRR